MLTYERIFISCYKVNSEYYVGWLDVWGGDHHITNPEWAVSGLNHLISYSMRVNVNM